MLPAAAAVPVTGMATTPICLVGASGRMGQRLVRLLAACPDLHLASVLVHRRPPAALPAGVLATADRAAAVAAAALVVDFAAPAVARELAPECARQGRPYLLASTALSDADTAALAAAAGQVAVLAAANLSLGVAVMADLVQRAAAQLPGFDVELVELHHRAKRDAPSGTAHMLAAALRGGRAELQPQLGRQGTAARTSQALGMAAVRGGDVAGEHTVYFLGDGERLEIRHVSSSGDLFAVGALQAARWLLQQPPGLYAMQDRLRG